MYFEFGGELDGSMDGSYRPLSFQNLRRGIEELSQAGGNHLTSAEIWEIASQMEERSDECEVAFFDFDERVDDPPQDCADIGFEDLLSSLLNWEMVQQRPDWRSMAEEVFASMDRDGDGTLDLKELQAGLLPTEDVGDLREMLAEVDGVKDGHISLPVFLDMLRSEAADSLELYPAIGSAQFASVDRR